MKNYKSDQNIGTVGTKLRELLELKGFNQVKLAEKSGLSTSFINNLIKGKSHDIALATAIKLANALGVSIIEFTNETRDKKIIDCAGQIVKLDRAEERARALMIKTQNAKIELIKTLETLNM